MYIHLFCHYAASFTVNWLTPGLVLTQVTLCSESKLQEERVVLKTRSLQSAMNGSAWPPAEMELGLPPEPTWVGSNMYSKESSDWKRYCILHALHVSENDMWRSVLMCIDLIQRSALHDFHYSYNVESWFRNEMKNSTLSTVWSAICSTVKRKAHKYSMNG